ncbi:MAG: outer membrane protein transport protein [Deltaproteobacteria bacterium]|nr:outer membrane protein transport protein [Deltaproteobacteria bacterium]
MPLLAFSLATASPVEFYGFGGRKMGRGGGGVALAEGAESIIVNPAALPGQKYPQLSIGFVGIESSFTAIPEVWWDTNRDGLVDENDDPLDVGADYDPVQGFMIGTTRPIGTQFSFGLGLFLPLQRIIRLQTLEPQLPTYFLYENRAQRYELALALGYRPKWGVSVGGGMQMIPRAKYDLSATLDLTLSGADEGSDEVGDIVGVGLDVHDMSLDLVPGFAPIIALHWDAGETFPVLDGLEFGAAWRGDAGLPVDVTIDLQINARAEDIGDIEPIVLPLYFAFGLGVFDHYTPSQLNFGAAYTLVDTLTLTTDVKRTAWDALAPSIAEVTHMTVNGAGLALDDDNVTDGNPYALELRPTWSPRAGAELTLPRFVLWERWGVTEIRFRGGVGYEPTPLVSQSADTALLDADRTIFAVGAGFEHDDPFRKPENQRRARLDGFFQYHVLDRGVLDRGVPEEPTAGYSRDGSPIPIGGHLYAAGVQWGLEY